MTQLRWPRDFLTVALRNSGCAFLFFFLDRMLWLEFTCQSPPPAVGGFFMPPQTNDLWEWQDPGSRFQLFESLKHSFYVSGWELLVVNHFTQPREGQSPQRIDLVHFSFSSPTKRMNERKAPRTVSDTQETFAGGIVNHHLGWIHGEQGWAYFSVKLVTISCNGGHRGWERGASLSASLLGWGTFPITSFTHPQPPSDTNHSQIADSLFAFHDRHLYLLWLSPASSRQIGCCGSTQFASLFPIEISRCAITCLWWRAVVMQALTGACSAHTMACRVSFPFGLFFFPIRIEFPSLGCIV